MSGRRPGATAAVGSLVAAIGLTLAAMVLTRPALALEDPQHPQPAAAAEGATPLSLRPSKPIELAPESSHASTGWKALSVLLILGAGAYALRKRMKANHPPASQLLIVRRAAIGFRSELLVVNVEGQRLLLGVTPNSIQSLAILDADEHAPAAAAAPAPLAAPRESNEAIRAAAPAPAADLGARFAAMLRSAEAKPAPEAKSVAAQKAAAASPDPEVGTQARGLMSLRRR